MIPEFVAPAAPAPFGAATSGAVLPVPRPVAAGTTPAVPGTAVPGVATGTVAGAAAAVTALVGCYVAYLAYRGYRRNDSETMRMLAVGVLFIAVVPYLLSSVLAPLVGLTDAQALLGATTSHALGLVAIYRSFG